jgi:uncharacterized membrane protein
MGAVAKYIRVEVPPAEAYRLWRDPTGFPDFMPDVEEVEDRGETWHWKVAGPLGRSVEWVSEVVEEVPGERLAWRSIGGEVEAAGSVRFDERDGDATDLEFTLEFSPPGGTAGEVVAKLFDDPGDKVQRALEAFKDLAERSARPRPDSRAHVDAEEASPATGEGPPSPS